MHDKPWNVGFSFTAQICKFLGSASAQLHVHPLHPPGCGALTVFAVVSEDDIE